MTEIIEEEYIYRELLDNNSPLIEQPKNISMSLKPHQLAEIHKARTMEQNDIIKYCSVTDPNQIFNVRANVGLLSDIVGYGKTMTALGIIIESDISDIHINNVWTRTYKTNSFSVSSTSGIDQEPYIKTTLVVVPRGPVYLQWLSMIKQHTKLNVFAIENIKTIKKYVPDVSNGSTEEDVRNFFEGYDLVLVKITNIKQLITYISKPSKYHRRWSRLMIDEAHDNIVQLPLIHYRFLWMITGTPKMFRYNLNNYSDIREIIFNETRFVTVKSHNDFVKSSFDIPPLEEINYKCIMSKRLSALRGYLNRSVFERINAGDITGAIKEMGVKEATIDALIKRLTEGMRKDITNKNVELNNLQYMVLTDSERETRMISLKNSINTIQQQLTNLEERINAITVDDCAICMDTKKDPVVLECTHSFCLRCIAGVMRNATFEPKCPECRQVIEKEKMTKIGELNNEDTDDKTSGLPNKNLSKEETMLKIINDKPDGKFLIFSAVDNSFNSVINKLKMNNITCAEIKGTTASMKNILDNFKSGTLKVVLLNTRYAGSGIDISCATDVIIYHYMGKDKTQAVGRAQRVGRTSPLKVHNLLHDNEIYSNPLLY